MEEFAWAVGLALVAAWAVHSWSNKRHTLHWDFDVRVHNGQKGRKKRVADNVGPGGRARGRR